MRAENASPAFKPAGNPWHRASSESVKKTAAKTGNGKRCRRITDLHASFTANVNNHRWPGPGFLFHDSRRNEADFVASQFFFVF
jgi:hypothetical protein